MRIVESEVFPGQQASDIHITINAENIQLKFAVESYAKVGDYLHLPRIFHACVRA